jgi:hypothetical protein
MLDAYVVARKPRFITSILYYKKMTIASVIVLVTVLEVAFYTTQCLQES